MCVCVCVCTSRDDYEKLFYQTNLLFNNVPFLSIPSAFRMILKTVLKQVHIYDNHALFINIIFCFHVSAELYMNSETTEGALVVASCLTTVLLIGVISVVINF